jgi:hypothetical protein
MVGRYGYRSTEASSRLTESLAQRDSSAGPREAVINKCIPLNTRGRCRARASAIVRFVDVPRALLAAGILALRRVGEDQPDPLLLGVASSGHDGHARDRLSGDVQPVK